MALAILQLSLIIACLLVAVSCLTLTAARGRPARTQDKLAKRSVATQPIPLVINFREAAREEAIRRYNDAR